MWLVFPLKFSLVNFNFRFIFLLAIIRISIYPVIISGWSSNNKYSFLGSMRRIAQTISYEVRLALVILFIILVIGILKLSSILSFSYFRGFFLLSPYLFLLWLISRLAETNRTPFDFAEGERELVSGFNVEYGALGFAVIFITEYARIYFLAGIRSILFFSGGILLMRFTTTLLIRFWIWARTTFPRYRYDLFINLAWKIILPLILSLNIFLLIFTFVYNKI